MIPTSTSWYLAELGEARGKQELFIKQSPQKLKVLCEHALIESAVSSNRIEGVEVEKSRINTLISGKPLVHDRNKEEVRNGRVSRLLLLLQCYQLGYEVGRYISLERLIEQNKERYYETLELSSAHWHEGTHNPWPYVNYILFIIKSAYKEFEERLGAIKARSSPIFISTAFCSIWG